MKVLALASGTKERSLIQNALGKAGHQVILSDTAEQALRLIEAGEARFVILDEEAGDIIQQVRASNLPPIYFLAITSGEEDSTNADDTLHKPFSASELRARIMIGQRFLALGDNLSKARDQIENMAIYDTLTGMMNRSAFYRSAQAELERARRSSSSLSLIALDIDNFKTLNEKYGGEMGDEVLKVVAQTIREKSRPYDCIGRWSGDEFVIALPNVIGPDAEKVTERIIKGIQFTRITYKDDIVNVAVSAGIASVTRINPSSEMEPLIQQARQAMSRAKESGGNQIYLTFT
ncbi:MAG: diguanylate cyclase [Chloroflexi bacterium]|nr:diguanylate cyclase [Chloroflexota bacterium]MBI1856301.1 diguanylate cyclase [Chloroflexota bacterium]MBI2757204.1 diguanylate cyclase [Chloroflexota bacterium]MBI3341365.1 diguanylate cyclase [Chloroflexota bacterium]